MTPYHRDPTPTPLFPMEPNSEEKGVLPPKKPKVPQEGSSDSMTPPHYYLNENRTIYWRPNNYRRQIEVKPKTAKNSSYIKEWVYPLLPTIGKRNKILSVRIKGITIQYMKKTLQGIYRQNIIGGVKEIYEFSGTTQENDKKIEAKKEEIRMKIDTALEYFIAKSNIRLPNKKPIWTRHEDFIKGESFVDSIPKEVIIHDTNFKKVYGRGIEFIGSKKGDEPTRQLRTYLKNRAVEEIAPEIADSIREITLQIGLQQDVDQLKKITLALIDAFVNYLEHKQDE